MDHDPLESDTPDWLRDIQVRSWEPEIILSSIITIELLHLPDWIEQQKQWYDNDLDIGSYVPVRGKHVLAVRTPIRYNYAIIPFFKK